MYIFSRPSEGPGFQCTPHDVKQQFVYTMMEIRVASIEFE
jgi:hypothetical protein